MKTKTRSVTLRLTRAAVIAGIYTALCWATGYLSWGPIQFRIAEALTMLPLLFPEAIVGVTVGCLLSNLLGSGLILDVAVGTAVTCVAAVCTWLTGRFVRQRALRVGLGCIPPVILNAFIIPFVLMAIGFDNGMGYWLLAATTGGGQLIAVCAGGIPLYFGVASAMGLLKNKKGSAQKSHHQRTESSSQLSQTKYKSGDLFMSSFILSTDSCADYFKSDYAKSDVKFIALAYVHKGGECRDNYDSDLEYRAFYDFLRAGNMPSTAQLNATEMEEYFEKLLAEGTGDIVHVTLSSGLSGTYDSAVAAAKTVAERHAERNIFVVDSLGATQVQAYLVDRGIDDRAKGMTAKDTAQDLTLLASRLNVIVMADDLQHLHRGGRVGKASAVLGTLFQIKPLIELTREGKLTVVGKVNGWTKGLRTMAKYILKNAADLSADKVFIGHADVLEDAERLAAMIKEAGNVDVRIGWIGPVIGAHTGAGTLTAICIGPERTL